MSSVRTVFSVTDSKNNLVGVAYVDSDGKLRAGLSFVPLEQRDTVRACIEWYANDPMRDAMESVLTETGHRITLTKAAGSYGACFLQNAS